MLLELTQQCHEQCTHCFINALPTGKHMSMETLSKTIDFIKLMRPKVIVISGGEITDDPEFDIKITKLIMETREYCCYLLESNGTWINDPEMCERISTLMTIPSIAGMQISSNKTYYTNYNMVSDANNAGKYSKISNKIQVLLDWQGNDTHLSRLGRATDIMTESDVKGKPTCSNIMSIGKQIAGFCEQYNLPVEFKSVINILELQMHKFCTPMVAVNGNIHVGESPYCSSIGNVKTLELGTNNKFQLELLTKLMELKFCNKCGARKNVPEHILKQLDL